MTATAIEAATVVRELSAAGYGPFVGVPCSFLAPIITWCERNDPDRYVVANNEGEAVAIAAGMYLAGDRPVVMMQNSGLGNAVNPLTSLCHPMRIPLLLMVTWRGEPGRPDEPQHRLMGRITPPLLELMGIGHEVLSPEPGVFREQLDRLSGRMATERLPVAFVVPKGTLAPEPSAPVRSPMPSRREVIAAIVGELPDDVVVVATTGKTGRELEADHDRPGNLYVVGSMGCASSIGLGIALRSPDRTVVVLDGDGAALMRMEALASIGAARPQRLVHVLMDNSAYESTGGQRTLSPGVDFLALARACGYPSVADTGDPRVAAALVRDATRGGGPHLIRVAIAVGSAPDLGRPSRSPDRVAEDLRALLTVAR